MIQGIVLCFAFLVAQLAVLHYIDRRLADDASDAPEASAVLPLAQQHEHEAGKPDQEAGA
ncbi:hypothetical protein [Halomonas sp. NO4]|uniref:hypothetical protein n=1 Tax=Halomonas sp. NO4 TaxID=2484813 RepID=UPI0013D13942|nr:hypothetical protein [Halomonas sp. NO4]